MASASSPPPGMAPQASYTIPSLSHVSSAISSLSTPHLHPILLPISPLTLVHALRVSLGTSQVQGGTRRIPLLQSVALDLILLFGGWSLVNVALGMRNPLMDAGNQWVALVYGGVHLLATVSGLNSVLMKVFAKKNVGCALDLVLSVVDGVCRMDGIVSLGVEPVRSQNAPLTPLITSILIGGGGPILIGLFNLDSPDWKLKTPDWLVHPTGLLAFDIWTSALVGWVYLTLSGGLSPTTSAGAGTSAILSKSEAGLVCTLILIALMAFNRLRVEVAARGKQAQQSQRSSSSGSGGKTSKAKSKTSSSSSSSSQYLILIALVLPLALLALQTILAGNTLLQTGIEPPQSVLFLLAHPDDEVMFFSPIIHSLLASHSKPLTFHALSLSNGNAPPHYLGSEREQEFQRSWTSLVSPSSSPSPNDKVNNLNVVAFDDAALQDGMHTVWDSTDIVRVVGSYFDDDHAHTHTHAHTSVDWIITFDALGISHHPNHIALAHATSALKRKVPSLQNAQVFKLQSHASVWTKYLALPGAIVSHIAQTMLSQAYQQVASPSPSSSHHQCFSALASPKQYIHSLQTMRTAHKSQFVWYRWLWWIFSTHVYAATLCKDNP